MSKANIKKLKIIGPIFDDMPEEFLRHRNWVLWRLVCRGNRWTKIPYGVDKRRVSVNDSNTWSPFEDVRAVYKTGDFDGVGFVFSANLPYVFIDIDKVSPGAGEANAKRIIEALDSYTEISPSGNGYHIFVEAKKLTDKCRFSKPFEGIAEIEVYSSGRFSTLTGARVDVQ